VWSREGNDDYTALIPVLSSQAAPHLDAAGFPLLRGLWRREQSDQRQTALFVAQRMTARRCRPLDGVHEVEQRQGAAPGAQDIVRPHGNVRNRLGRVGWVFPAQTVEEPLGALHRRITGGQRAASVDGSQLGGEGRWRWHSSGGG
jgi:hypothetical protein